MQCTRAPSLEMRRNSNQLCAKKEGGELHAWKILPNLPPPPSLVCQSWMENMHKVCKKILGGFFFEAEAFSWRFFFLGGFFF
jgi:hypothetical protein